MNVCGCRQSMDLHTAAASRNFNKNFVFVFKPSKLQIERQHFHTVDSSGLMSCVPMHHSHTPG